MGDRRAIRTPMAWQATLGEMQAHGTRLAMTCTAPGCGLWVALDVSALIIAHGEAFRLWDGRPACVSCGRPGHYMASPGPGTPFTPLLSGPEHELRRKAFLKSFGFSRRDITRIRALAERDAAGEAAAALGDLDVPVRVGACEPGREGYSTGRPLGTWAGRTLLWWPMNSREQEVWRRRPKGPRGV